MIAGAIALVIVMPLLIGWLASRNSIERPDYKKL